MVVAHSKKLTYDKKKFCDNLDSIIVKVFKSNNEANKLLNYANKYVNINLL